MLSVTRSANLPRPEVNAWIVLPDNEGAIQGDFVWREQRLIVETDGHSFHGTRQAFERDRRRDQRLTMHGWRVVRVTSRKLKYRPHEVAAVLITRLGQL